MSAARASSGLLSRGDTPQWRTTQEYVDELRLALAAHGLYSIRPTAAGEELMSLHIAAVGDWTRSLYSLVNDGHDEEVSFSMAWKCNPLRACCVAGSAGGG